METDNLAFQKQRYSKDEETKDTGNINMENWSHYKKGPQDYNV